MTSIRSTDYPQPKACRRRSRWSHFAFFLLLWTIAVVSSPFQMSATTNINASFEEANKLYAEGKYEPAALAYEQIVASGYESAAVYFNAGNAWFKTGNLGKAIAAYMRARELAPRDNDIRANLRFTRSRVNPNTPNGGDRWQTRLDWLKWNEWGILTALFVWLWFGLLILRQLQPRWSKSLSPGVKPACLMALLFALGLGLRLQARSAFVPAVVTVKDAAVRYGPLDESKVFYSLTDGVETEVLDRQKDWVQVKDNSRRIGWLRADQLRIAR